MRHSMRELLLGAVLLCAVSARGDAQAQAPTPEGPTTLRLTVPNFVPVTLNPAVEPMSTGETACPQWLASGACIT